MVPFTERFGTVLDSLNTTPYKFAGQHDLNRSSMFNMLNGKTRPNLDMLERICVAEPRISAEYLLRGEGEPLRPLNSPASLTTVEALREFQIQMNAFVDSKIREIEG